MRNHKTGCGRCHRNVCCCPRRPVATSCICPPGPQGPPGPPGSNATPGSGGGLLKFSGSILTTGTGLLVSYLADTGVGTAPPLLLPVEYQMAVDRTLVNLALNVIGIVGVLPSPLTFDLLVDGTPVLSVEVTSAGPTDIALGSIDVLAGQLVSLRATSPALTEASLSATATVGIA